jgi:hypothetical protein
MDRKNLIRVKMEIDLLHGNNTNGQLFRLRKTIFRKMVRKSLTGVKVKIEFPQQFKKLRQIYKNGLGNN